MKLQEIIVEEKVKDYITRLVRTLKIRELGAGYFSTVFQHPVYHNVAVKVTHKSDPLSIVYLENAMKHPDNPWFPKIIGIYKVGYHGGDMQQKLINMDDDHMAFSEIGHIVFMQKLRRATAKEIKNAVHEILATLPQHKFKYFRHRYVDGGFENMDWELIEKYTTDEHVRQVAALLNALDADDIHEDNVMMRDDGVGKPHLVFTDPVASEL